MAQYNISNATTTDFSNKVPDFIVESMALDVANSNKGETYIYYEKATENYGYQYNHPQVDSPLTAINTWAFGQGWKTEDKTMEVILKKIDGNGKETFDAIIQNHGNICIGHGDSFCEIIRNKQGTLVNLISISPERVKTIFAGSRIKRYEIWNGSEWVKKRIQDIFHSINKKLGDSTKGRGNIQTNKNVNDAMIEAFEDERIIKHRDKALGVVYYKTNNAGKISYANSQIEKAVKNGEMVGLPEDTATIQPYPSRSSEDRQSWIQYLENFIYQIIGVPRSIATSDGTSEVGGKMGNVNFEPTYAKEREDMERDLWSQQAIKVVFEKQNSLGGLVQDTERKNTGQVNIQPNDVTADMERE